MQRVGRSEKANNIYTQLNLLLKSKCYVSSFQTSEAVEEALSQLSNEQIEQFRKYFNMFDKEKKGYIHTSQVGQILRTMGQAFEDRDLKQLIKEFDTDGSGEIEFEEFAALVARFVMQEDDSANMEEELREAFRLYDKEGNGYINVSDLRDILRALDENITEDELDEMIAEIDTDGSGTVDFDELRCGLLASSETFTSHETLNAYIYIYVMHQLMLLKMKQNGT
ncbi:putative EF hand [Trichinella nativa]|uniref:Putative EF hand n=1 Tax=Trichinella nativa TaxID=6335 RepID=A0A1Y3EQX7_9BILA|nr:putative EF hand [Trichinella nativa]